MQKRGLSSIIFVYCEEGKSNLNSFDRDYSFGGRIEGIYAKTTPEHLLMEGADDVTVIEYK